jgi:Outer membrane protein beta-barrel domain
MKKIIGFIFFLSACYSVSAQQSYPKFSFSLNGGASVPTGNFAKGDYADETSGFAKTGGHFNIAGTRYLNKNWGVTLLVGYSSFGNNGTQSLADGYKEDSGTDSTTLYSKGTNYSVSFLIGPTYRFNPGNNFFIDARALVGYVSSHLAGFQIFYEDYTTNSMTQNPSSAGAFGFQGGLGFGYTISKQWTVQVNGDYFTSKPDFKITYDNFVVNSGRKLTNYNQPISGINVTVGVSYSIW